jgi:hypothetical protein
MWLKMGKNGDKCMKNPLIEGGAGELDHILTITIPQLYLLLYLNYTYITYLLLVLMLYVFILIIPCILHVFSLIETLL